MSLVTTGDDIHSVCHFKPQSIGSQCSTMSTEGTKGVTVMTSRVRIYVSDFAKDQKCFVFAHKKGFKLSQLANILPWRLERYIVTFADRYTGRHALLLTDRHTGRHSVSQTDRQTYSKIDRQTDIQGDSTDRQKLIHTILPHQCRW